MNIINTNIFTGFSELYDIVRPHPPQKIVDLLLHYKKDNIIDKVVDIGSGTGLSTAIWINHSKEIIGIEPTNDMRSIAQKKYESIDFRNGDCYDTGIDSNSVDIVTCSQAFHFMEPRKTIDEITRILKHEGMFCVYDCVFPVTWDWECEKAYEHLFDKVNSLMFKYDDRMQKVDFFSKEEHYNNLVKSDKFSYVRKIYLDNIEECSPERFINIAFTQGQLQDLVKQNIEEINISMEEFSKKCNATKEQKMYVSYEVIIGIKK